MEPLSSKLSLVETCASLFGILTGRSIAISESKDPISEIALFSILNFIYLNYIFTLHVLSIKAIIRVYNLQNSII